MYRLALNRGLRTACPISYSKAWTGPWGSRRLRLAELLRNRHMKVVRLSALRTGRLYPRRYFSYSFLLKTKSTPRPQCGRKHYVNEKSQWPLSVIEPATFQPVALCLNQPPYYTVTQTNTREQRHPKCNSKRLLLFYRAVYYCGVLKLFV